MMNTNYIRTYSELISIKSFRERLDYLKLDSVVGYETFGKDRYLNQVLYRSGRWRSLRNEIILRDNGCDLAYEYYEIYGTIIIHHMNPITVKDITDRNDKALFNPEYLVCTSIDTHNMIHYGSEIVDKNEVIERLPNDTCPWK